MRISGVKELGVEELKELKEFGPPHTKSAPIWSLVMDESPSDLIKSPQINSNTENESH